MKKIISRTLFLLLTLFNATCMIHAQDATNSNPQALTTPDKQAIEQLREQIEQTITEVRKQTENIGYAVQQLTQAVQANKIGLSKESSAKVLQELINIQGLIDILLKKVIIQTNPEIIQLGLIVNKLVAKHLLKAIETNFSSINAETLHTAIEHHLQKQTEPIQPETIMFLLDQNHQTIADLIHKTDFIGLTWYNKTYRFLKDNNAYGIARGTTVVLATSLVAACIYKSYYPTDQNADKQGWIKENFDNIIGAPGKIKYQDGTNIPLFDKNGQLIKDSGSGILKFWDSYKNLTAVGLIAPIGFSLPIKDILSGMYSQYWENTKMLGTKYFKKLDNACSGSEKKYDLGDCEKAYFQDMTGAEHLEEIAKRIVTYLQHPERYERTQMEEHRGILLHGPPQTGKTLFAKALKTLIDDSFKKAGIDKEIKFMDVKKFLDINRGATLDDAFWWAQQISPCIMFFDELDLIGAHREKNSINTGQLLTNMQGIDMASNKIFMIGATNKLEQIDKALLVDGRFGKMIHIDYPKYHHRKAYLVQQLEKRNIQLDPAFVDYMAQETDGASYNKLKRLITESLILSTIALRPVTQEDFEKILDSEVRKIENFATNISLEEKKIIATYQAGKALTRQLLKTKREVVKITILPVAKDVKTNEYGWAFKTDTNKESENDRLAKSPIEQKSKNGDVFTKTTSNNTALVSDEEYKKEALCLLAGHVAQKIIFKQSFSQCNPQDRAEAVQIIHTLISQGETIDKALRTKAIEIKAAYEQEIEQLLIKHKNTLEKIINKLIENNSINRYEWQEIIKNCPSLS